jgi:RHS repeat-associated protein
MKQVRLGTLSVNDQVFNDDFASAAVSPSYDDNGNLTFDGVYKYKYDAWNRLVQVRAGEGAESVLATYTYDATGRRIKKVVSNSGDLDTTEVYYYAGQQMIEARNGSEQATRQFVFGTQYVDEPIRMDVDTDDDGDCIDTGDKAFYYHQDANYNVTALTDSAGAVVQYYLYDAYGTVHPFNTDGGIAEGERLIPTFEAAAGVPTTNPFTYTGRFLDQDTGLYYYRARHYHASLGRFLQRDPFAFQGKFIAHDLYYDGLNLYRYVQSRPIGRTDPTGLGPPTFKRCFNDRVFALCIGPTEMDCQGKLDRCFATNRRVFDACLLRAQNTHDGRVADCNGIGNWILRKLCINASRVVYLADITKCQSIGMGEEAKCAAQYAACIVGCEAGSSYVVRACDPCDPANATGF